MEIDTCKHYNGTHFNTHCKAGVKYDDVTTDPENNTGKAFRKPCIDWDLYDKMRGGKGWDNEGQKEEWARRGHCDKREAPTVEEVEADEAEREERFKATMEKLKNNICPKHNIAITKKQVGRCVYAEPCGCRLYQGTI